MSLCKTCLIVDLKTVSDSTRCRCRRRPLNDGHDVRRDDDDLGRHVVRQWWRARFVFLVDQLAKWCNRV